MQRSGALLITILIITLFLARWEPAETRPSDPMQPPVKSPTPTPPSTVTTETEIETEKGLTTDTPIPTATEIPLTEEAVPAETSLSIPTYPPNKLGDILVLVYHVIGRPEGRWTRTPENLRADLEYLLTHGYYPVNLIDVARGNLDHVPYGRRPIVLTFDDSTTGQFRYLEDGTIDPDCAVGILKDMHEKYGEDWPLRGTFFVLLNAGKPGPLLFRQSDLGPQKVSALVDWGMEIGSHTITHPDFSQISPDEVRWELAVSQDRIEALVPGYQVHSLALPYGSYPSDTSLIKEGYSQSEDLTYRYEAAVRLGARPAPSPFSIGFDPFLIPRVQAIQSQLGTWFSHYEKHPERYYVSD